MAKGKILGRCVEMWDTFNGILDQGVSRNPDIDEDFMHTDLQVFNPMFVERANWSLARTVTCRWHVRLDVSGVRSVANSS
jgi:hypothetical protein